MDIEEDFQDIENAAEDLFEDLQDAENLANLDEQKEKSEIKSLDKDTRKKRTVQNLASLKEKLLSPKVGVASLAEMFQDVKFKGKEDEDLNLLLSKFETWAHHLFPRYTFEDVVESIEELGSSKQMRSHVHMIVNGENMQENESNDVENNGNQTMTKGTS